MTVGGDLFVYLVIGLAVPLAVLDALRTMLDGELPSQGDGLQLELRVMPWLLAVVAGPALLFDRVAEGWRTGVMVRGELMAGIFITAGWATLYGFVLLKAARLVGA
jgi:hypothetical protein